MSEKELNEEIEVKEVAVEAVKAEEVKKSVKKAPKTTKKVVKEPKKATAEKKVSAKTPKTTKAKETKEVEAPLEEKTTKEPVVKKPVRKAPVKKVVPQQEEKPQVENRRPQESRKPQESRRPNNNRPNNRQHHEKRPQHEINVEEGNIEQNPAFDVNLNKLRQEPISSLNEMANNLGITEHTRLKKSELVFKILKAQTERNGFVFGGGVLEITQNNYGFLRSTEYGYRQSHSDIYVSPAQIKRFYLKSGDTIVGQLKPPTKTKDKENYYAITRIEMINGEAPEECKKKASFDDMTPIFPKERFTLETTKEEYSTRIIDLFSPIGKGQRGLIVAPPKSGKTVLLKEIALGIKKNHPDSKLIVLLIDERPEEVTDFARIFDEKDDVEVVASTFDEDPVNHVHLAEIIKDKAKRLVEHGKDVVILLDSITRLTRAYNSALTSSGKVLSGGIDANAFKLPKRFFGAARKLEEGGSLTIIATALVDTGSKMDEVIFEEFKGTGNMELALERKLADKRIFPAIDVIKSGTRREEFLLDEEAKQRMWILRKILSDFTTQEAVEFLLDNLGKHKTNKEFIKNLNS